MAFALMPVGVKKLQFMYYTCIKKHSLTFIHILNINMKKIQIMYISLSFTHILNINTLINKQNEKKTLYPK